MSAGLRVLVCGGRDYDNWTAFAAEMDMHAKRMNIGLVVSGGARGADTMAKDWALSRGIPVAIFPANWTKHGKAAGPIRNQSMIDFMRPDVVIAFAGGRGTADMIQRAINADVTVIQCMTIRLTPTDTNGSVSFIGAVVP
jgi:hypothetical protein